MQTNSEKEQSNANETKKKQANTNRRRGKSTEKVFARRLGGKRVGIFGKEDVTTGLWAIEVKDRKKFVGVTFMNQAIRNCPTGQTPMVIVHEKNQRFDKSLILVRLKDWEEMYGPLFKREEEG